MLEFQALRNEGPLFSEVGMGLVHRVDKRARIMESLFIDNHGRDFVQDSMMTTIRIMEDQILHDKLEWLWLGGGRIGMRQDHARIR